MGLDVMAQWMVEIGLPEDPDRDFFDLIPRQRRQIDKLFKRGVINSYTLSFDRSKLWVLMYAKTRYDVDRVIDSFPMRHYMTPTVHEIMFHQQPAVNIAQFSLN